MTEYNKGDEFFNPKTGETIKIIGLMANKLLNTKSYNSPEFPNGACYRLFPSALVDFEKVVGNEND